MTLAIQASMALAAPTLSPPVPGLPDRTNTFGGAGATPDLVVEVWTGSNAGSSAHDCGDLPLGDARMVWLGPAAADGTFTFDLFTLPEFAHETSRFVAVEPNGCEVGPNLDVLWEIPDWTGTWYPSVANTEVRSDEAFAVFGSRTDLADIDGDGLDDLVVAAPHHTVCGDNCGAVFLIPSPVVGNQQLTAIPHWTIAGAAPGDWFGFALTSRVDLDGNGLADVLASAHNADNGGVDSGSVFAILMPIASDVSAADTMIRWDGDDEAGNFGMEAASIGDGDGDGLSEVVVGSPLVDDSQGRVDVMRTLPAAPTDGPSAASLTVLGLEPGARLGARVGDLGDLDGDGILDLGLGSDGTPGLVPDAGSLLIFPANLTGVVLSSDASARVIGEFEGQGVGSNVETGDLDGDGSPDLIVSALEGVDLPVEAGTIGAFRALRTEITYSEADILVSALGPKDYLGAHAAVCDLDGSGQMDLIVGAHGAGTEPLSGAVYVFYDPVPGTYFPADASFTLAGVGADRAGQDVKCGDVHGDGGADLLVGSEGKPNILGEELAGAVYLFDGVVPLDEPTTTWPTPSETGTPPTTTPEPTTTPTTDSDVDTGTDPDPPISDPACGCTHPGPGLPLPASLAVAGLLRRRSGRRS